MKEKKGVISRLGDPYKRSDDGKTVRYEVFGSDLFKKETNMKLFLGMKVETEQGDVGEIKSSFGTSGKFRAFFPAGTEAQEGDSLYLRFRRYAHDAEKKMHQLCSLPAARSGAMIEVQKKKKGKKELPEGVKRVGEISALKGDILENGKHSVAIISGFFAPEVNIKERAGIKVFVPSTNEEGSVVGPFGKAGKCKVAFEQGLSAEVGSKAELQI
jgi:selenocysteine-specific elongation factor